MSTHTIRDETALVEGLSGQIIAQMESFPSTVKPQQIKNLQHMPEYQSFKHHLIEYLVSRMEGDIQGDVAEKGLSSMDNAVERGFPSISKLLEQIQTERRVTRLMSTVGVGATAAAAISGIALSMQTVVSIASFGAVATLVGWISKIRSEVKAKDDARGVSRDILATLETSLSISTQPPGSQK